MRLAGRFFLASAALSVLPVAATAGVVSQRLRSAFEEDLERRVAGLAGRVQAEYERTAEELRSALARLAPSRLVEQALLVAGGAGGGAGAVQEAPRTMRALGLDVLTLVGPDGTVIAAGHLPGLSGREGPDRPAPWGPGLVRERVRGDGGVTEVLTIQVVTVQERYGHRLELTGGRRLDEGFLGPLVPGEGTSLALVDDLGKTVARAGGSVKGPARSIPLGEGAGKARLVLRVSRDALDATLAEVVRTAAATGGGAVVLALLASLLLASRLTRPLRGLEEGVRSVAGGDLDQRLPERGSPEVVALVRAFNRMTADLAESRLRLRHTERVAAWRDVARRIAHEVKNPLSPLRTAMETLRKAWRQRSDKFPELLEESTEAVLEEVDRINRLVTGFSEFARMPAPDPVRLDLAEAVGAALALHGADLPDGVTLDTTLRPDVTVLADRDRVVQVVSNLLKNAGEALADQGGGRVLVEVEVGDRGRALLAVQDDGPGLTPTVADDPFAPYVTTKSTGSGLGLAEVQRIAVDHGGEARHVVPEGGGCRFEILLPREK